MFTGLTIVFISLLGGNIAFAASAHKGPIVGGDIAGNAEILVTMSDHPDHMLVFWNPATGKGLRRVPTGQVGRQSAIVLSPDGKLAASGTERYGGDNYELAIFDTAEGKSLHKMRIHKPKMEGINLGVLDLQFSPDSTQLLVTTDDAWFFVYDPVSGKQLRYFQTRVGNLSGCSAAWLPDGKTVLMGSKSGAALVDTTSGKILKKYPDFDRAEIVDISANGKYAIATNRSDIVVFEVDSGNLLNTLKNGNQITDAVIAANAPIVACTDMGQKFVTIFNAKTGAQINRAEVPAPFLDFPGFVNLQIGGLSIDNQTKFLVINSPAAPYIIPLGNK
jgi:WD40 repeat protein